MTDILFDVKGASVLSVYLWTKKMFQALVIDNFQYNHVYVMHLWFRHSMPPSNMVEAFKARVA